jgi:hypothetical protein
MDICIYSVFVLVAALRWADPTSKEAYRLSIFSRVWSVTIDVFHIDDLIYWTLHTERDYTLQFTITHTLTRTHTHTQTLASTLTSSLAVAR